MVSESKNCDFAKSFAQESEYGIINKSARVAPLICKVVIICGGFSSNISLQDPWGDSASIARAMELLSSGKVRTSKLHFLEESNS